MEKGGYQQQECGPWGITLTQELDRTMRTNTAFSQFAWESAKQEGCHYPCPERKLPSWPPCGKFIYPTLQKDGAQKVVGVQNNGSGSCCSVDETVPVDEYGSLQPGKGAADLPWQNNSEDQLTTSIPPLTCGKNNGLFSNEITCAMKRAQDFLRQRHETKGNQIDGPTTASAAQLIAKSILQGDGGDSEAPQIQPGTVQQKAWPFASSRESSFNNNPDNGPEYGGPREWEENENNKATDLDPTDDQYTIKNLLPCILNTYSGIAYDLAHLKELPTNGTDETAQFILLRDDRHKYLIVSFLILLFVLLFIAAIVTTAANGGGSS